MSEEFNPGEKIIRIQGGALYLQVKDRLIWLRHEAPESQVRTEALRVEAGFAFFKATVTKIVDGEVKGVGEGHGSETAEGFPPGFIEKAETIAIGRALAALGYGTAAAFEEDGGGKIADAPVSHRSAPAPPPRGTGPVSRPQGPDAVPQIGPGQISDRQMRYLMAVAKEAGVDNEALHGQMYARFKVAHVPELTKQQASKLIDYLKAQDFVDAEYPPPERVDAEEAREQAPQLVPAGPEEPEWMRNQTWQ